MFDSPNSTHSKLTTRSASPFSPNTMFILPAEAIFSSTSNSRRRISVGLSASNFAVFAWLRIAAVSSRREIKLASAAFLASVALRQQVVRRSHVIGAEKCLDHIDPKRQTNFRFWQRLTVCVGIASNFVSAITSGTRNFWRTDWMNGSSRSGTSWLQSLQSNNW